MQEYICGICGYVYREAEHGPWQDLPADWRCPICNASTSSFTPQGAAKTTDMPAPIATDAIPAALVEDETPAQASALTPGLIAAICSNLARGAEKQYLDRESQLFTLLAEYYTAQTPLPTDANLAGLREALAADIAESLPGAKAAAQQKPDRGALRVTVWAEKVSLILSSLLKRYQQEGAFFAQTNMHVCSICGYVHVADAPPEICPVCKVPQFKFVKVAR
jgi:rubrerythrin